MSHPPHISPYTSHPTHLPPPSHPLHPSHPTSKPTISPPPRHVPPPQTDANLVLGRIVPDFFPKIFGPSEREPLDLEGSTKAFESLREEVNAHCRAHGLPDKTVDEVAFGFLKVANEAMCRPIRELTQMRGYDAERHVLACFGGAGGQHACAIARMLGMKTVFIHRHSGVLSAVGIHLAGEACMRGGCVGTTTLGYCTSRTDTRTHVAWVGMPAHRGHRSMWTSSCVILGSCN